MKIAVASPKGGAGKTTLTACLALSLLEAGKSVDAWDYDPQAGLSNWMGRLGVDLDWMNATKLGIAYVDLSEKINHSATYGGISGIDATSGRFWRLEPLTNPAQFQRTEVKMGGLTLKTIQGAVPRETILGDFPPLAPKELKERLAGWDRILIPCQPSPVDVQAVVALVAVFGRDPRLRLVWNALDGSAYSRPDTLRVLSAEVGCPVAKATIPRRVGFRNAQHSGWRGLDEASKSAILSLALEVTS